MTPPQTLLEVLRRQHARISALLRRVMHVDGGERREAVTDLLRYLALHESAEQIFVHPAGLRAAGDRAAVQGRVAEEHEIEAVIANLEGLDPDSMDFMIYFGLLEEALSGHLRAEEDVEVRMLGASLDHHDLDRMARDLDLVDAWMDPAIRSIGGSVAQLPFAANGAPVRYGDLQHRSLLAFGAVARAR